MNVTLNHNQPTNYNTYINQSYNSYIWAAAEENKLMYPMKMTTLKIDITLGRT